MSGAKVNAGVKISAELKRDLQAVAQREDRTLSKLCEMLLSWSLKQLDTAGDSLTLQKLKVSKNKPRS
jgi:hypothetical protein